MNEMILLLMGVMLCFIAFLVLEIAYRRQSRILLLFVVLLMVTGFFGLPILSILPAKSVLTKDIVKPIGDTFSMVLQMIHSLPDRLGLDVFDPSLVILILLLGVAGAVFLVKNLLKGGKK